jgi:mannose-6-phosphate isomerase-like protein (cupin superfamily)
MILSAVACLVVAMSAHAQNAPATITSADRLRAIGDSLSPAASRTAQLGKGSGYTYAVTHRDSSGGIERHRDWTDVFVVEAGSATMFTGGVNDDASETSPGEYRGGSIRGGTRAAIKAGDLVVVPAGTPHQMLLSPTERISYLAFKIAAMKP